MSFKLSSKIALTISILILNLLALVHKTDANDFRRRIQIINESGQRFEVFWVSVNTGELILQLATPVVTGSTASLNSFVAHAFELREMPSTKTGECSGENNVCHSVRFTVNENQNQAIHVMKDYSVQHHDDTTRGKAKEVTVDLVRTCEDRAKSSISDDNDSTITIDELENIIDELISCAKKTVATKIKKSMGEVNYQANLRMAMAEKWENYTCKDDSLSTSPTLREYKWNDEKGKKDSIVDVLHEKSSSQIHFIHDFITDDECKAMEEAAKPKLHKATVASGDGGYKLAESRKAMQAGVQVNWDKEKDGDLIAKLSRRVYDYNNYVTGLNISEFGQEKLMSIQYTGRGEDYKTPDRYLPHCDGDCETGLPHRNGTRVATMIMYCDIPSKGGHTNFKNAGVHVKPKKNSAVYFLYMNPENHIMDKSFTIHSGCPVIEGEKKIVTQWIRHGVDDENPWNSFNSRKFLLILLLLLSHVCVLIYFLIYVFIVGIQFKDLDEKSYINFKSELEKKY